MKKLQLLVVFFGVALFAGSDTFEAVTCYDNTLNASTKLYIETDLNHTVAISAQLEVAGVITDYPLNSLEFVAAGAGGFKGEGVSGSEFSFTFFYSDGSVDETKASLTVGTEAGVFSLGNCEIHEDKLLDNISNKALNQKLAK